MRMTIGRDSLGRITSTAYRMGDGTTTASDTVNRTQSGRVINDIVQSGSNSLWYAYGYDGADRLTSMSVGANSFSYGFGMQNAITCGSGSGTNADSGKNGNRTTQTINSITTTFCYDYADRLIGSSDQLYNSPTYDTHGNMTQIGTGTTPLHLFYDSSDRSSGYEQYNSSTTGVGMYYDRDVQGRIIARYKNTITAGSWANAGTSFYHFTGSGDAPDYVRDNNWDIIEKNIGLPGGVNLTIKPQESIINNQEQYSLPNIHGDTLLMANAVGTNTSNGNGPINAFTYDAFGNALTGSVLPANTNQGSYGYAGAYGKLTESNFNLTPIQMGVRVYLPQLGRFLQSDPMEGGASNGYAYALDPINSHDHSGKRVSLVWAPDIIGQVIAADKALNFSDGGTQFVTMFLPALRSKSKLPTTSEATRTRASAPMVRTEIAKGVATFSRTTANFAVAVARTPEAQACAESGLTAAAAGAILWLAGGPMATAGDLAFSCFMGASAAYYNGIKEGTGDSLKQLDTYKGVQDMYRYLGY
jgi:RHS repeat-associated protein